MVKSAETLVPAQQSKITITVKVLVPVIAYGNIAIEATQEIETEGGSLRDINFDVRSADTIDAILRLQHDMAMVILPMVEAEVTRYASILVKEANPSYWMSKNSTVYTWFRIAYPDIEIPAMTAIMASKPIPNSGLE